MIRVVNASDKYVNKETPLLWSCSNDHLWYASLGRVKNNNTWCPQCAKCGFKLSLDEMQKIAHEHGGECLSKEYTRSKDHYYWKCAKGHIWTASFTSIRNSGTWCPICYGFYYTIEDMRKLALERGGACLGDVYIY